MLNGLSTTGNDDNFCKDKLLDVLSIRSLGKFREAEAIEAQMKMKGVTQNVDNGALIASAQAAIF